MRWCGSTRRFFLGQVVSPVLAARHNAQHCILQPNRHNVHASLSPDRTRLDDSQKVCICARPCTQSSPLQNAEGERPIDRDPYVCATWRVHSYCIPTIEFWSEFFYYLQKLLNTLELYCQITQLCLRNVKCCKAAKARPEEAQAVRSDAVRQESIDSSLPCSDVIESCHFSSKQHSH